MRDHTLPTSNLVRQGCPRCPDVSRPLVSELPTAPPSGACKDQRWKREAAHTTPRFASYEHNGQWLGARGANPPAHPHAEKRSNVQALLVRKTPAGGQTCEAAKALAPSLVLASLAGSRTRRCGSPLSTRPASVASSPSVRRGEPNNP